MALEKLNTRIILRNDTATNWASSTVVLAKGEVAIDTTNGLVRVGTGANDCTWDKALPLGVDASQISSIVQDYSKEYQIVADGTNKWKLQTRPLSGGDWEDATGTIEVDFSALTADVAYLSSELSTAQGDIADARTTLNTVSSDYVKATDFAALSNEIGLSAASASNPVVTKDDIADLAGAMHFRGAVTPNEGETDAEAIAREITDPASGDIVIVTTTSKEYVYNGTAWIELGDEVLYATKAEVAGVSAELTSDIAGLTADVDYLSGQIDATNETLNTVSSDYLKAADKTELETLVGTTSAETLVSANAYTDSKFAGLSDYYTKDEVDSISSALSTDYVGKIGDLETATNTLVETVSAQTLSDAKDYTDEVSAALSADYQGKIDAITTDLADYALSADVDSLVEAAVEDLSATVSTDYIRHGEVVQSDLSGFFVLDGGSASLRTDEPTV